MIVSETFLNVTVKPVRLTLLSFEEVTGVIVLSRDAHARDAIERRRERDGLS